MSSRFFPYGTPLLQAIRNLLVKRTRLSETNLKYMLVEMGLKLLIRIVDTQLLETVEL